MTETDRIAANCMGPSTFAKARKAAKASPKCGACGSTDHLRISGWHHGAICSPCFFLWYDGVPPEIAQDPVALGAESRRRKQTGEWPYDMAEFKPATAA